MTENNDESPNLMTPRLFAHGYRACDVFLLVLLCGGPAAVYYSVEHANVAFAWFHAAALAVSGVSLLALFRIKVAFALLAIPFFLWAAWSTVQWLFFPPQWSDLLNPFYDAKWAISIVIESGIGAYFWKKVNPRTVLLPRGPTREVGWWESIKGVGAVVLVLWVFGGIAFLITLFIYGGAWLSEKISPWLFIISALVLLIVGFLLLPLALSRKTRGFSGLGMIIASYVFGLNLWVWGLLVTYTLWGTIAVFIGLLLMGIGVVPIAMLATLFNGMWSELGELVLLTVLTFGAWFGGSFLVAKSETDVMFGLFGSKKSTQAAFDVLLNFMTDEWHMKERYARAFLAWISTRPNSANT